MRMIFRRLVYKSHILDPAHLHNAGCVQGLMRVASRVWRSVIIITLPEAEG